MKLTEFILILLMAIISIYIFVILFSLLFVSKADITLEKQLNNKNPSLNKKRLYYSITKRFFDILFGINGSLIAIIIIIILKINNKINKNNHPLLYKFPIYGYKGKIVYCYRLCTMMESKEPMLDDKHEPIITKTGNFLRKTGLDSFPLFFSLLKGDLSIIGITRIPMYLNDMPEEQKKLYEYEKPGIVGLYTFYILKNYYDTYEDMNYASYEADLKYLSNRCFKIDLSIMAYTMINAFRK